jgi:predicted nucleotidyltransferase
MARRNVILITVVGRAKQCFLNLSSTQCRHFLQEVDLARKEAVYKTNPKLKAVLEELSSKITKKFTADIHSITLFGSYAKGTATKDSDVDLLFMISNIKDKAVRNGIERESSGYQYSHNLRISILITDIEEFKKMLKAEGMNVGKETRAYGIPLYGSEQFWRILSW